MVVKSKCVHCGEQVSEWTRDCPVCGRPVANPDAPKVTERSFKTDRGKHNRKKGSIVYVIIGLLVMAGIVVIHYLQKQR